MKRATAGFTLIEVLVAVTMLGVGIVALAGSSALVTRMIGRGQITTRAAEVGSRRLELLRMYALSTSPKCTSGNFVSGNAAAGAAGVSGVSETWTVVANGTQRTLTANVVYKTAKGQTKTATFTTILEC
ncbi:MAG TPA: prepilin-type N-terminal cleavage/methylation domain-containing protein [Gemmatimonadales bacterium]|nr:prepilin-type N-terminal cleavage/methylation domain-containing protein [Gemmatimonadales bacterium]